MSGRVVMLDCESPATTLLSLASATGTDPQIIRDALLSYREEDLDNLEEDTSIALPRNLLHRAGIDIDSVQFNGVYFFHGTRVTNPATFLISGIQPLAVVIDAIWRDLHRVAASHLTHAEWKDLRRTLEQSSKSHAAGLYRRKMADVQQHGPFASLARRDTVTPRLGIQHDYMTAPEIIEDIHNDTGIGILSDFKQASSPCVVKYKSDISVGKRYVEAAVLSLAADLCSTDFGLHSVQGDNREGRAVPALDIIYVDELSQGGNREDGPWIRHTHAI